MSDRESYERALAAVRSILGTGFAVVPMTPDATMVCAALDATDKGKRSYTDTYQAMVGDYVKRRGVPRG